MGRIKGTIIKRATRELMEKHKGHLSESFEENKKIIAVENIKQKNSRNSIAGYITRLVRMQKKDKK
jgi:small subunit ribosomal protein S17e